MATGTVVKSPQAQQVWQDVQSQNPQGNQQWKDVQDPSVTPDHELEKLSETGPLAKTMNAFGEGPFSMAQTVADQINQPDIGKFNPVNQLIQHPSVDTALPVVAGPVVSGIYDAGKQLYQDAQNKAPAEFLGHLSWDALPSIAGEEGLRANPEAYSKFSKGMLDQLPEYFNANTSYPNLRRGALPVVGGSVSEALGHGFMPGAIAGGALDIVKNLPKMLRSGIREVGDTPFRKPTPEAPVRFSPEEIAAYQKTVQSSTRPVSVNVEKPVTWPSGTSGEPLPPAKPAESPVRFNPADYPVGSPAKVRSSYDQEMATRRSGNVKRSSNVEPNSPRLPASEEVKSNSPAGETSVTESNSPRRSTNKDSPSKTERWPKNPIKLKTIEDPRPLTDEELVRRISNHRKGEAQKTPDIPTPRPLTDEEDIIPPQGVTRLFRAEHPQATKQTFEKLFEGETPDNSVGGWFTTRYGLANMYKNMAEKIHGPGAEIKFIDLPSKDAEQYQAARQFPTDERRDPSEHFIPELRRGLTSP